MYKNYIKVNTICFVNATLNADFSRQDHTNQENTRVISQKM